MKSFDKEIKQFLIDGTFNNNLDDAGNVNLSIDPIDINQRYIEIELENYLYNNDQIAMLYDVEIREFSIPTSTAVSNNIDNNATNQLIQENEILRNQLNAVIAADNQNSASAVIDASKDIIISLRIKLNEGKTIDDFSNNFPYLKK